MVKNEAGFTLVEVTIGLAITGGLLVIALTGQRQLRNHNTFTAATDQVIQSLASARNDAVSGVIPSTTVCGGQTVGSGNITFGGTVWRGGIASGVTQFNVQTVVIARNRTVCSTEPGFSMQSTHPVPLVTQLTSLNSGLLHNTPDVTGAQVIFLRSPTSGGFSVCLVPYSMPSTATSVVFSSGNCPSTGGFAALATENVVVRDPNGQILTIKVDGTTGLATR
ncbi:prepilin-type N-terminal cleavage/methylation domain-containing protein [Candidatus Saccharibacteria bacterium]|nr:prepilin-type N-terminal cleavage/methylation domain-containing protein [Candidatus Saccharibacteria bacterium]